MKIIDENETIVWLAERGLMGPDRKLLISSFPNSASCKIPVDAGRKNGLSKLLASLYEDDEEALLWINEYGIWPSCEDWVLFDGFRRSLGEDSPLYEKPGHIFSKEDIQSLGSLLAMVFYFFWGAVLVSTTKDTIIRISHDEFIDIFVKDEDAFSELNEMLGNFSADGYLFG